MKQGGLSWMILILLAFQSTNGDQGLYQLSSQVEKLAWSVTNAERFLENRISYIVNNTETQISHWFNMRIAGLEQGANAMKKDFNVAVERRANGIENVKLCELDSSKSIDLVLQEYSDGSMECFKVYRNFVYILEKSFSSMKKVGDKIMLELEDIFPTCQRSHFHQTDIIENMRKCVSLKITDFVTKIHDYENMVLNFLNTIDPSLTDDLFIMDLCIRQEYDKSDFGLKAVEQKLDECITHSIESHLNHRSQR